MGYTFKRPDPAAMERVLARFPYSPEGAILRLAWLEGLSREEIAALTWDQVQFEDNALTLPDRTVPLAPSAEDCLRERYRLYAQRDPHVIISDRYQRPMPPESVSRLARTALDTEGQKVSLKDLRQDFVIRQLQTHPGSPTHLPFLTRTPFAFENLHAVFVDCISFSHTYSTLEMRVVIEHLRGKV